jgi:hypothetical protein
MNPPRNFSKASAAPTANFRRQGVLRLCHGITKTHQSRISQLMIPAPTSLSCSQVARSDQVAEDTDLGQHGLSGVTRQLRRTLSAMAVAAPWIPEEVGQPVLLRQSNSFQVLIDASRGIPHAEPHTCKSLKNEITRNQTCEPPRAVLRPARSTKRRTLSHLCARCVAGFSCMHQGLIRARWSPVDR